MRIGMDLTRIPLPTFILEKRSLLEMYAEFLAHPDIFTAINKPGRAGVCLNKLTSVKVF